MVIENGGVSIRHLLYGDERVLIVCTSAVPTPLSTAGPLFIALSLFLMSYYFERICVGFGHLEAKIIIVNVC